MQKLAIPSYSYGAKEYCLLTKPGIIAGNLVTTASGFALASKGHFDIWLFLITLVGLGLVIASACVCNNYIDRHTDKKMARTKNRALATGAISSKAALLFAAFLGVSGTLLLLFLTNFLTTAVALFGFFSYVILYSFSKYYSIHGTLIGSVAGAVPPVVGYCAVSHQLDLGAWILFAIIVLWQMPHFFAIGIYRLKDYAKAAIPILPLQKGMRTTKIHMLLYIIAFMAMSAMLTVCGYTGYEFLAISVALSVIWAVHCIRGFKVLNDTVWARQMFIFSLVVVMAQSIMIPFSVI